MKLAIVALRDVKTDQFGTPMFLIAVAQGVRSISDEVNSGDVKNQLCSHPEDFELFELGSFETQDASFELHSPKSVVQCSNLRKG